MLSILLLLSTVAADMINLDPSNIDATIKSAPLVMINFSAGWCRYSQALKPIYEKAASELSSNPNVKLSYADCVAHSEICSRYRVNKFPTMKFIRSGELMKSEYRGQRSVEAITNHIKQLLEDPVKQLHGVHELQQVKEENKKQKFVLGHFTDKNSYSYQTFRSSASIMSGQCKFYSLLGDDAPEKDTIYVVDPVGGDQQFQGVATDAKFLSHWVKEQCVPIVREITFENGEELTEEGLPFVILFHDPEDTTSVELFTKKVLEQCSDQRDSVNFLHADGFKFAHPLSHLGKTTRDLPVLAIDSFKHMYLFPEYQNLQRPGRLRRFVEDLHSGRLHREFHGEVFHDRDGEDDAPADGDSQDPPVKREAPDSNKPITDPPKSVFKKLEPSENRYSILNKDEL